MAAKQLCLLLLLVSPILARRYPSFRLRQPHKELHRDESVQGDVGEKLVLTSYLEDGRIEEARNLSRVTGGHFPEDIPSYSGFFTVNGEYDSNMFFWFFPAENDYENAPVVLWLQGGPGASSMMGLFTEMGPFLVTSDDLTLVKNPYSWHKNHSLIFIDNPVGTGKYIPALGHAIHMNIPNASININLKDMAIGNGYVDAEKMIRYSDLVYQWGLVDNSTWKLMQQLEDSSLQFIAAEEFLAADNVYNIMVSVYRNASGASIHNILKEGSDEGKYYFVKFLEISSVRSALHVGNQSYVHPSVQSYVPMHADVMQSVSPWVEELLDSGYRIVFYNGQLDFICAYALTVKMVEALRFNAAEEYKTAERKIWYVDGKVAGYTKTAGNMTEMLVRNAGHMVPADQPAVAFHLIYQITRNQL